MRAGADATVDEVIDGRDAGCAQPVALHRTHPGDQQQIAGAHDLGIARGTPPARDHAEFSTRVAPRDRGPPEPEVEAPVRDERAQPGPAQTEDRQELIGEVHAGGAVAQQQLDAIGARHAEAVELIDVCRELHERGHPGAARELAVLHDPSPGLVPHQEVGEPDELVGREGRLIDDVRVGGEGRVRARHRLGEGRGIRRSRLGDLDDAVAECGAVAREHPQLVLAAEPAGPFERDVLGLFHGGYPPDAGIDPPQPRELALRSGFEVARTPDHARLCRDVSQWFPFVPPIVRAGADSGRADAERMLDAEALVAASLNRPCPTYARATRRVACVSGTRMLERRILHMKRRVADGPRHLPAPRAC